MAERFIKYGNRTIPMPDDMKLDQAKEIMAFHFPELAENPKIETKKDGETTTYTFSKQAGRKGSGTKTLVKGLARIKPRVIISPALVGYVTGTTDHLNEEIAQTLGDETERVGETRTRLLTLAPSFAGQDAGVILL
jgi:PRTRC genetic system protein C